MCEDEEESLLRSSEAKAETHRERKSGLAHSLNCI